MPLRCSPVTDAAVLSQHVGGVILVVGTQKLRHHDLQKSLNALDMVGSNLLGVVLNRLPSKGPDAYAYSYYSSDDKDQKSSSTESRAVSKKRSQKEPLSYEPPEQNDFDLTLQAQRQPRQRALIITQDPGSKS